MDRDFFSASDICAGYGGKEIMHQVSFGVEEGSLLGILGANGSGKTTLLKALCGILPHRGCCTLDKTALDRLSPRRLARLCSYIPQRSGISIQISALDVVLMGFNPQLGLLERPSAAMKEAACRALALVGLGGWEQCSYLYLSEGQKQLCILARTLVTDAKLLLLDEAESALDFRYRYRMLDILRDWLKKGGRCAVVTLHDPGLALNGCDRLLLLSEGRVLDILSPGTDPLNKMEQRLKAIYGPVSLQKCRGKDGSVHLVMLKEREME